MLMELRLRANEWRTSRKISCGEGDCQGEAGWVCGSIDAVKYVVLGLRIFIPDFSERSERSRDSCRFY